MSDFDIPFPTSRDDIVFRDLLERRAAEHPDRIFAVFEDGSQWTYADARAKAVHVARGLHALGVRQGDKVVSWQPTGGDAIRTLLGINYLGATYVPFNTSYRGHLLEHVLWLSDAKIAVVHPDLVARLGEVKLHELTTVISTGTTADAPAGLTILGPDQLAPGPLPSPGEAPPPLTAPIEIWDAQAIIFTSGTTGPSKAVIAPYQQLAAQPAVVYYWLTAEDRVLLNLPMFHCSGVSLVVRMLAIGGSLAVVESFRTDDFWPTIRRMAVTYTVLQGSIASFLVRLDPCDDERNTTLRSLFISPLTPDGIELAKRIGVDWYSSFSMTEISGQFVSVRNPEKIGSCGRPRVGASVRIVDEHDFELPVGAIGELVVRDSQPWVINSGYHKCPEETAHAWRNGWFHTGDGLVRDADGDYFYKDRIKDAIRRRGENISSFELEYVVNQHPDVRETAAIGVPSPHGEDEVMIVIVAEESGAPSLPDLVSYLIPRLPHYMVPRYIRAIDALPRTPSMKVQKALLRTQGITDDTFDREDAGISVRRQRFTKTS